MTASHWAFPCNNLGKMRKPQTSGNHEQACSYAIKHLYGSICLCIITDLCKDLYLYNLRRGEAQGAGARPSILSGAVMDHLWSQWPNWQTPYSS